MNHVIVAGKSEQVTMSSTEIADLVEARHDSVKRTIERLAERSAIQLPPLVEVQNHLGQRVSVYSVGKRDSYVIVAQLSPEFTARLVDRWQELEQQVAKSAEPAWLANLTPQAKIAIEDLNNQVEALTDETNRLQGVCNDLADNLVHGITPAAFGRQLNGVNVQQINKTLVSRGYLIKTKHGYRASAYTRDKYFTERREPNRDGFLSEVVVLTAKGAKWLYAMYEKDQLVMKKEWDGEYRHDLHLIEEVAA